MGDYISLKDNLTPQKTTYERRLNERNELDCNYKRTTWLK